MNLANKNNKFTPEMLLAMTSKRSDKSNTANKASDNIAKQKVERAGSFF